VQKAELITKNSTEAELVALSDYVLEGELIEDFLMDLGHLMDDDLITNVHHVYQDNTSTITIVRTGGRKARFKYMKVREEYIRTRQHHLNATRQWFLPKEPFSTSVRLFRSHPPTNSEAKEPNKLLLRNTIVLSWQVRY
jgi:hypothetical protein